jgi:serine/threonine protein kinase
MPPKKSKPGASNRASEDVLNLGPELTDISVSELESLPTLSKECVLANPKFVARSFHSQVYTVDLIRNNNTSRAIIKIFPKGLKNRYTKEVNAYRFLYYYGAPEQRVVPRLYGVLPTISKKRIKELLQDAIPDNVDLAAPASALVMEYIEGIRPTQENMTDSIAKDILEALNIIHSAHVLHGDVEPMNILISPQTGRAVWIDFSASEINKIIKLAIRERRMIKQTLYSTLVILLNLRC